MNQEIIEIEQITAGIIAEHTRIHARHAALDQIFLDAGIERVR